MKAAAAPPVRDHATERRWVGRSIRRVEDPKFLRGQGGYIADRITPGTLHAAVLRSPHPHARIVSIDASRARALPGVHAVISGKQAAELCDPMPDFGPDPARHTWRCLAADKVRYLLSVLAATPSGQDPRRRKLIQAVLDDFDRLSCDP